MLVLPNDEFREAVNGNWGVVNLPVWRDSKVRSLYTSVTASDIMGVPPLPQEEAVPSLPQSLRVRWELSRRRILEENLSDFVIRCPGTTRVISLFEIFVPDFWNRNYGGGRVFQGSCRSCRGNGRAFARFSSYAVGEALRSRNQSSRPCRHASRKLAQASGTGHDSGRRSSSLRWPLSL